MIAAWQRVMAIASNTLTEALRQKVLGLIILFGLVVIGLSETLSSLAYYEEGITYIKDVGHAAISLIGLLVVLIGAAQLIPAEIERRTLFTVLSKPVSREEFLLGKFVGLLALLTLLMLAMAGVFALFLWFKETQLAQGLAVRPDREELLARLYAQSRDIGLVQAWILNWFKLAMLAAVCVLFSTIGSSTTFVVSCSLVVYLSGYLQGAAREGLRLGAVEFWLHQMFLGVVVWLVPDFGAFDIIDDILAGRAVPWSTVSGLAGYASVTMVIYLIISALFFRSREF